MLSAIKRWFFSLWYLFDPPWDTGISPPELMEFIRSHPAGRALDLGCGTGTNVITLAKHGWQVTGVDYVPRAIRSARRKAHKAGVMVDLRVDDVTRLDTLNGCFDFVIDMGCFHGLSASGRQAYIHNLDRILNSGGIFLLYAFVRAQENSGTGISDADIADFLTNLTLLRRKDGIERGRQRSAWFTFRK